MTKEEFETLKNDTSIPEHKKYAKYPYYYFLKYFKVHNESPQFNERDSIFIDTIAKIYEKGEVEDVIELRGIRGRYLMVKYKDENDKSNISQGAKLDKE